MRFIDPSFALALLGCSVCLYALHVEFSHEKDETYQAFCDISQHISCSKVLTSPYSRGLGLIGPDSGWLYQRNPIYGLLFYSLLMCLDWTRTRMGLRLAALLSAISCLTSVYLSYLLIFVLKDLCLVCCATYTINAPNMLWHITAGFLYVEMFVVFLFMLPLFSTRSWSKFFKSSWVKKVTAFSNYYFNFFLILLGLVLVEASRQVMNQRSAYTALKARPTDLRPETESLYLMRMFRAQRNLYIAGFALFMWFVFRRLVRLICDHAQISTMQEASLKQARSASDAAERLMTASHADDSDVVKCLKEQIRNLEKQLENEKQAHESVKQDLVTLKKQAQQTTQEYDRLSTECQELQSRLAILSGSSKDKKSD
ncbi:unnamed protein product [Dicrocoelium dendriticum]|nr:unnamed protein product [Dicrocoelium dendriticum]